MYTTNKKLMTAVQKVPIDTNVLFPIGILSFSRDPCWFPINRDIIGEIMVAFITPTSALTWEEIRKAMPNSITFLSFRKFRKCDTDDIIMCYNKKIDNPFSECTHKLTQSSTKMAEELFLKAFLRVETPRSWHEVESSWREIFRLLESGQVSPNTKNPQGKDLMWLAIIWSRLDYVTRLAHQYGMSIPYEIMLQRERDAIEPWDRKVHELTQHITQDLQVINAKIDLARKIHQQNAEILRERASTDKELEEAQLKIKCLEGELHDYKKYEGDIDTDNLTEEQLRKALAVAVKKSNTYFERLQERDQRCRELEQLAHGRLSKKLRSV